MDGDASVRDWNVCHPQFIRRLIMSCPESQAFVGKQLLTD